MTFGVIEAIFAAAVPVVLAGAGWLIHQLINSRSQVAILKEEVKKAHETNERQANDFSTAKSVRDSIDRLSNTDISERLHSKWKSPQ